MTVPIVTPLQWLGLRLCFITMQWEKPGDSPYIMESACVMLKKEEPLSGHCQCKMIVNAHFYDRGKTVYPLTR